jgi:hypothetical protein
VPRKSTICATLSDQRSHAWAIQPEGPSLAPFPFSQAHVPGGADYREWLAHDPTLAAKIDAIFYSAQSRRQAREVLGRLFTPGFVDTLAAGGLLFADPATGAPVAVNEVDAVA